MALVPTCGRRPRGAECRGGGGGGGGGGREGPDLLVDLHGFLVLLQLGRVRGHLQQTLVGRATGRWSRGGGHGAASPLPPQHRGSPRSPETPAPPQHNPRRGQERAARMRRAASSGEKTPGGGSGFGDGPPAAEPGRGADPARRPRRAFTCWTLRPCSNRPPARSGRWPRREENGSENIISR